MKSLLIRFFSILLIIFSSSFVVGSTVFAAGDDELGVYAGAGEGIECIKNGCFTMKHIPMIIVGLIDILLGLAGTIAIVALIYHAVQMQLASGITGDSSGVDKAKAGMKGALLGFALSLSAWFLVTKFVELIMSAR